MGWRSLIRAAMTTKMNAWPTLKAKFPAVKVNILCEPMALSVEWRNGQTGRNHQLFRNLRNIVRISKEKKKKQNKKKKSKKKKKKNKNKKRVVLFFFVFFILF